MSNRLDVRVLGNLSIKIDGKHFSGLPSKTAEALFVYVMLHDHPITREKLASFFWHERTQKQATANLRSILSSMRKKLGDFLTITRTTVAFNHDSDYRLDSADFTNKLIDRPTEKIETTLGNYRGDFLAGFYLREAPEFDEWAVVMREQIRRFAIEAWQLVARRHLEAGSYGSGLHYAAKWQQADPLDEAAYRHMMWLLARSGQRTAALQQFQHCRRILDEELGVEPAKATVKVYERIRRATQIGQHNLSAATSPFLGRANDLKQLITHLATPDCRLLTLLGPGGMGKTRLAQQVARTLLNERPGMFLDGIFFVALESVVSAEQLPLQIANALELPIISSTTIRTQLFSHLRNQEILLICDNMEQLIDTPGTLDFFVDLMVEAPHIKLLFTSRERLNLIEEIAYEVTGLCIPTGDTPDESGPAPQLYISHARRLHRAFNPSSAEIDAILRTCALLGGSPLAIKLAAGWTRQFTPLEIETRIQTNLDFLQTAFRNSPPRHRSLRAVFEHSWALLSDKLQTTLVQLSIFKAQFDREAAQAVTLTDIYLLSELADKSLLTLKTGGLYALHPLIRQFSAEKRLQSSAQNNEIALRHASYYADLMKALRGPDLLHRHVQIKAIIDDIYPDIRAAILWSAKHNHAELIEKIIGTLNFYLRLTEQLDEMAALYSQTVVLLEAQPDSDRPHRYVIGWLTTRIAYSTMTQDDLSRATVLYQKAITIFEETEIGQWLIGFCYSGLSSIASRQGEFQRSIDLALKAVDIRRATGAGTIETIRKCAINYLNAGQLIQAKTYIERMLSAIKVDTASHSDALQEYHLVMGGVEHQSGRLERAKAHFQSALAIGEREGSNYLIAQSSLGLARIQHDLGDAPAAESLLQRAEIIAERLINRRFRAATAQLRGRVHLQANQAPEALITFSQAAKWMEAANDKAALMWLGVYRGLAYAQLGDTASAETLIQTALDQFTAADHPIGQKLAQSALDEMKIAID